VSVCVCFGACDAMWELRDCQPLFVQLLYYVHGIWASTILFQRGMACINVTTTNPECTFNVIAAKSRAIVDVAEHNTGFAL